MENILNLSEELLDSLQRKMELKNYINQKWLIYISNLTLKEFNGLVLKLITKHERKYIDRCLNKGYEPNPNILLTIIIDFVMLNGIDVPHIDDLTKCFPSQLKRYGDFVFALTYGQGTCFSLYDLNNNLLLRL